MSAIPTLTVRGNAMVFARFEVTVVDGPDRGATVISTGEELAIGTARGSQLVLTDGSVSRHHCVLRVTARGIELRDLGSTNGTFLGDHEVVRGYVRSGAQIRIGDTTIVVKIGGGEIKQPLASGEAFGELIGASPVMRRMFAMLEQYAPSDATVLLHGETGTGKELVAEAIHGASARRDQPFVVVDCGALPRELVESELFGHVRGAFTGADTDRVGAFEAAHGGTLFLDEIAELPRELQPVLLRALEGGKFRRVGSSDQREVDVRVIAASHRDLRGEVNEKRFRADLYYRLDVLRVVVPPLHERVGDVVLLAKHFWRLAAPDRTIADSFLHDLERQRWPGNVRELRNTIQRAAVSGEPPRVEGHAHTSTYGHAKDRAIDEWEARWVARLLAAHDHNLLRAARAAQMGRSHLRQLARKHGIERPESAL